MLCDDLEEWGGGSGREAQGGGICLHMTDLHYCRAENNTTL